MKQLLFIGHEFHKKTKSADFIKDLLALRYNVECYYINPSEKYSFENLADKEYDVLILWQVMPSLKELHKFITFQHCAFFPMYDNTKTLNSSLWNEYTECNIINFSKTFHKTCQAGGLSSYYIQYFPEQAEIFNYGEEDSVFFWQRSEKITTKTIEKVINVGKINKLYLHKSTDPDNKFKQPAKKWKNKVIYSTWFDTKEEMQNYIQQSAIYFAPRKYEGIGMSFLEAMAAGRCVIAPDYPTMNEYIKNGETGYLYNFKRPQKIKFDDIRKIQKNTLEYIKHGYAQWQKEKYSILDYIEKAPVIDIEKIKENIFIRNEKRMIFGIFPAKVKETQTYTKYEIFNFIPLRFNNP